MPQRERASDVHLDPDSDGYQLRYRIDGAVIDAIRLSAVDGRRLVRACKALAQSRSSNVRIPQDGRTDFKAGEHEVAVRVAVAPTVAGEKLNLPVTACGLDVAKAGRTRVERPGLRLAARRGARCPRDDLC